MISGKRGFLFFDSAVRQAISASGSPILSLQQSDMPPLAL
jgi:hypothetical protein